MAGMRALLVAVYELGRQPFGLASPAAWLRAAGVDVVCVDAAKERLTDDVVAASDVVGIHLPMHTATRLSAAVIRKVRAVNPSARLCAYGLYAPLNEAWLRSLGVDAIFGGEFEEDLTHWVVAAVAQPFRAAVPRIHFLVPDRSGLPPLSKYATLQLPDGSRRLVGYTEASRGCKHLCRHCPIVPIYNGHFRIVQPDVVLADIDAQVAAGARHITFGDPDFFNGPSHALRIVKRLHDVHPAVSYDVTIKVEHLLKHREMLATLAATGCAFVTSAVESVEDRVLALLAKGHTRQDFVDAVALCREAQLTLVPTFVAFHPWLTLESYCDLLDTIEALDLVDHVAPIQLAIRLLIPAGSRLFEVSGTFGTDLVPPVSDTEPLTYRWAHSDPRVDALHADVSAIVARRLTANRRAVFDEISALAHDRAGIARAATKPRRDRATVPYLNEPWYC